MKIGDKTPGAAVPTPGPAKAPATSPAAAPAAPVPAKGWAPNTSGPVGKPPPAIGVAAPRPGATRHIDGEVAKLIKAMKGVGTTESSVFEVLEKPRPSSSSPAFSATLRHMNHRFLYALALATLTAVSPAHSALNELPRPGGDLRELIERAGEDSASLARWHSIRWSEARWKDVESLASSQLATLERVQFDTLSQQGKIDYLLLRNKLRESLAQVKRHRIRMDEMKELLPSRTPSSRSKARAGRWSAPTLAPRPLPSPASPPTLILIFSSVTTKSLFWRH